MGCPGLGEAQGAAHLGPEGTHSASGVQLGRTRWPGGAIHMVESVQASCSGMAVPVKGQRWEWGLKLKLQSGVWSGPQLWIGLPFALFNPGLLMLGTPGLV